MAAWHPYPYSAMMGSRSRLEQPGFIANLPQWGGGVAGYPQLGGAFGGHTTIGRHPAGVGAGYQSYLGGGSGAAGPANSPYARLPAPGARYQTMPGGGFQSPAQYPPGFGGAYPAPGGAPGGQFYPGGSARYDETGQRPLAPNDPFLDWIRQQYGQYMNSRPAQLF